MLSDDVRCRLRAESARARIVVVCACAVYAVRAWPQARPTLALALRRWQRGALPAPVALQHTATRRTPLNNTYN